MANDFCRDCKFMGKKFGLELCERTREHGVDLVTGKPWSFALTCSSVRSGGHNCANFAQKPTLWERVKECFNGEA